MKARKPMPKLITITCACGCGRQREVREADVKRGWGKYFDKTCKAKDQAKKKGKGKPKRHKGGIANAPADVRARTIWKAYQEDRVSWDYFRMVFPSSQTHILPKEIVEEMDHCEAMDSSEMGWDSHKS